jgi:hypothetical protein
MTITDASGRNRLSLQCEGGHFRSLVWSSEDGRDWQCRAVITQPDFQSGRERQRCVTDLHSFDPATGRAIIKVGEKDPLGEGFIRCAYSWREWDLLANRELHMLRICEEPSEGYENPKPSPKYEDGSPVVIDCKDEHWDDTLYVNLYNRRAIQLRNLHSSYEGYMKEFAEMHFMEFVGHFAENRGEFKRRGTK